MKTVFRLFSYVLLLICCQTAKAQTEQQIAFPGAEGFGRYTTFDISKPVYKNNKVQFTIKNTGNVDGTEVVQVYVRNTADKDLKQILVNVK